MRRAGDKGTTADRDQRLRKARGMRRGADAPGRYVRLRHRGVGGCRGRARHGWAGGGATRDVRWTVLRKRDKAGRRDGLGQGSANKRRQASERREGGCRPGRERQNRRRLISVPLIRRRRALCNRPCKVSTQSALCRVSEPSASCPGALAASRSSHARNGGSQTRSPPATLA